MTRNIQVSKSTIEVAEAVIWEFNSSMGDFGVCKSIVKDVKMCGYRSSDSRILFMNKGRDYESYLEIIKKKLI